MATASCRSLTAWMALRSSAAAGRLEKDGPDWAEACEGAAAAAAAADAQKVRAAELGRYADPDSALLRVLDPPRTSAASPSGASCFAHLPTLGLHAVQTCRLPAARRSIDSDLTVGLALATATATGSHAVELIAAGCLEQKR